MSSVNKPQIEQAVRLILEAIGEDPNREGLLDTPKRVAKMYEEVFSGLNEDPKEHFKTVYGKAHVAYIPKGGRVTGLSKLARAVEAVAKRPQLQERITSTVADSIVETLEPHGVMVVVEAEHMCMTMRGIKKPGAMTITSAVRGVLEHDASSRAEVLSLIKS